MIPFPYADENKQPGRHAELAALIGANGAALLASDPALWLAYGFVPADPDPHRWVTSLFLHAGMGHLAGNMWFLWLFGDNVAGRLGAWFLPFYLASGLAANAFHLATHPGSTLPCIGASGAVSGVIGAYLVFFPRARLRCMWFVVYRPILCSMSALVFGLGYLAWQYLMMWLSGDQASVAYGAHLGGALFGMVAAALMRGVGDEPELADSGEGGERPESGTPPAAGAEGIEAAAAAGRGEGAAWAYLQAVRRDPYFEVSEAATLGVADQLARLGHPHLAKHALEKLLLRHPRSPRAAHAELLLGWVEASCFMDYDSAARAYRRAAAHPAAEEDTRRDAAARLQGVEAVLARTLVERPEEGELFWVLLESLAPLGPRGLRAVASATGEAAEAVEGRLARAPGVVLRDAPLSVAAPAAQRLEGLGVPVVVIPQRRLLPLPPPQVRLELRVEAAGISFPGEGGTQIPWENCLLIMAQGVSLGYMEEKKDSPFDLGMHWVTPWYLRWGRRSRRFVVPDLSTGEWKTILDMRGQDRPPREYDGALRLVPMIDIFSLTPLVRYRWLACPPDQSPSPEVLRRYFDTLQELILQARHVPLNRSAQQAFRRRLDEGDAYGGPAALDAATFWELQLAYLKKEGAYQAWSGAAR